MIIWLGLGELAWIGTWLLGSGETDPEYVATATIGVAWEGLVSAGSHTSNLQLASFPVLYHAEPDASPVFQFPMLLASNFTVPLFAVGHVFALVKLLGT